MFTAADVLFSADEHRYTLPTGEDVPSVTTVLKLTGVSVDFEEVARTSPHGEKIDLKRDLGRALHADAHAYDDGDLLFETVDPLVLPYLEAWVTFRLNTGLEPVARERAIFHPRHHYAGTLDGIFRTPEGKLVLADLKTGDLADSGCAYQTAAYLTAWLREHPTTEPIERWGVQLTPGRGIPYRIERYTDWRDFQKFLAFLTTFQHQAARRRR